MFMLQRIFNNENECGYNTTKQCKDAVDQQQ